MSFLVSGSPPRKVVNITPLAAKSSSTALASAVFSSSGSRLRASAKQ